MTTTSSIQTTQYTTNSVANTVAINSGTVSSLYVPNQFFVDYSFMQGLTLFSYNLNNKLLTMFEIDNISSMIEKDLKEKSLSWINNTSDDFAPVNMYNEFKKYNIHYSISLDTDSIANIEGNIYHYVEVIFNIIPKDVKDSNTKAPIKGKALLTHSEFLKIKLSS